MAAMKEKRKKQWAESKERLYKSSVRKLPETSNAATLRQRRRRALLSAKKERQRTYTNNSRLRAQCATPPTHNHVFKNRMCKSRAVRMRKVLGGGWRQAGVLAAAALFSLDNIVPRLGEDHKHAKLIAQAMMSVDKGVVDIDVNGVDTNIITVEVVKPDLTAAMFCNRMMKVTADEESQIGEHVLIKMNPIYPQTARILTHNDVSPCMVDLAIKKLQYVITEFANEQ